MCGICVIFQTYNLESVEPIATLISGTRLHNRGPDICHSENCKISQPGFAGFFHGCTLCFQGQPTSQPLEDEAGNYLLWNGEIFGGIDVSPGQNDGRVLLSLLNGCQSDVAVLRTLGKVQGPWAFVYWQIKAKTLWFGRDIFGRRSLLYHLSENKQRFVLSSVNIPAVTPMKEVPANGIYRLQFETGVLEHLILHPWLETVDLAMQDKPPLGACAPLYNMTLADTTALWSDIDIRRSDVGITCHLHPFNSELPLNGEHPASQAVRGEADLLTSAFDGEEELAQRLIDVLSESVRLRIDRQSNLCNRCLEQHHATIWSRNKPQVSRYQQPRQYRNEILTEDTVTPSDQYGMSASGCQQRNSDSGDICQREMTEMQDLSLTTHRSPQLLHSTSICRSDEMDYLEDESNCSCTTLTPKCSAADANRPLDLNVNKQNKNVEIPVMKSTGFEDYLQLRKEMICDHAKVAVLFSGGIDSLVIAALADRYVSLEEPIDLINVAFEQHTNENPQQRNRKKMNEGAKKVHPFDVPDRLTGKLGLEQLNPRRKWNFIEVNVTAKELQEARTAHVRELVYPQNTVLDDSIGCAIWFAARGAGIITDVDGQTRTYTTTARVLLLGMGADEQLAGYSRHRGKFKTEGWRGLVEEIRMEIERISSRNLGRDDRVISDHGREARFPFLDENVVSFLNTLPIWQKADLNLPRGIGEKRLLRVSAAKLGLRRSAMLPKRAIQFGSRIAKMENRKEKASDLSDWEERKQRLRHQNRRRRS